MREFGVPEHGATPSLSSEEFARLTPQQQLDQVLLREFDRMGDLRQIILDDPSILSEMSIEDWQADPDLRYKPRQTSSDRLRKEWVRRNPYASGQGTSSRVAGSYKSIFPANEAPYSVENILFKIMSPKITEEEIALALDDPMFGSRVPTTNAEIDERVYARRYANQRWERPFARWEIASQVADEALTARHIHHPSLAGPNDLDADIFDRMRTERVIRHLPARLEGPGDVELPPDDPSRRGWGGRTGSLRRGIGSLRQRVGDYFAMRTRDNKGRIISGPGSSEVDLTANKGLTIPPQGISGLRRRTGRTARDAGITLLKAIRDKLPAVVAAGAATAATSHPVSAAVDIALSPEGLGSGGVPRGPTRISPVTGLPESYTERTDEEKMRYYDELANLQRELGVGQHPSFLQSPEWNAHLRSSYPMGR